jgi:hypothetical protein
LYGHNIPFGHYWLAVLVAAIAYFALGALWYGAVLSKQWLAFQNNDLPFCIDVWWSKLCMGFFSN